MIDEALYYQMLTSSDEFDVNIASTFMNNYRGTNKKLKEIIYFYKEMRKRGWPMTLNFDNLDLRHQHIDLLPEGMNIETLFLRNSKITKLPNNLAVRYLHIEDTKISEIPKNLTIGYSFHLKGSKLAEKFNTALKLRKEIELKGGKWEKEYGSFVTDIEYE